MSWKDRLKNLTSKPPQSERLNASPTRSSALNKSGNFSDMRDSTNFDRPPISSGSPMASSRRNDGPRAQTLQSMQQSVQSFAGLVDTTKMNKDAFGMRGKESALENKPEIHVIGEILGAEDLKSGAYSCQWELCSGDEWDVIAGKTEGQTQFSHECGSGMAVWSHPIDIYFSTVTLKNWPKLILKLWKVDEYNSCSLCSYG